MPIDPNDLCPGGTGKKIKFCCPDLHRELQKVDRMLDGEQYLACAQHIDRLLAEHPDRACLLAVRVSVLRATGKLPEARQAAASFLEKHPGNQVALAESAIATAVLDGGRAAMPLLQQALVAGDGEVSLVVYEAVGVLANALLGEGEWVAARAMFQLQWAISREDQRPMAMLAEISRSEGLPLLLKEDAHIVPRPEGVAWDARFDSALAALAKGKWQQAADRLSDLARQVPNEPTIWRNLSVLRAWLADHPGQIEALRKLAALDIPLDDAVEAEATAMLTAEDPLGDLTDVFTISWTVNDPEQLQTALSLDKRALPMAFDPSAFASEDNPPPRGAYMILDRPIAEVVEPLTLEHVARVLGQALVYGRQTDRAARIELIGVESCDLDRLKSVLREMAGDALGAEVQQEVMARVSASQELLRLKWRAPASATVEQLRALASEHSRNALLRQWPELKLGVLDGKTPREAACDPSCRARVLAAILVLETWHEGHRDGFDFDDLRRQLGLPIAGPIDPRQVPIKTLPLVRLARVEVEKASDEALLVGFERALAFRALDAVRKFARAVVDRPSFAGKEPLFDAYRLLVQTAEDSQQGLDYLDRGRRAAESAGQSSATWDLLELACRLSRGEPAEMRRLIEHIQAEHGREPGVMASLRQFLIRIGALRADGTPAGPAPDAGAAMAGAGQPAPEPGRIWTPDSQQPGSEKKIWTPG